MYTIIPNAGNIDDKTLKGKIVNIPSTLQADAKYVNNPPITIIQ